MRYLLEQTQTAAQLGLQGIAIFLLPMMLHKLVVVTACLCALAKINNIGPWAFEEKQLGDVSCVAYQLGTLCARCQCLFWHFLCNMSLLVHPEYTRVALCRACSTGAGSTRTAGEEAHLLYDVKGHGQKRKRDELDKDCENSQGGQEGDGDGAMEVAENAYHLSLVELLRHPKMYTALGLSGPPQRITHSTLEERIGCMRVLQ